MTTSQPVVTVVVEQVRCPYAISFLHMQTRCQRETGHNHCHEGRGHREHKFEVITWQPGDSREFMSDRPDPYAWEEHHTQP